MDLTILEIHLPDAEFNAPFAGGVTRGTSDHDAGAESDSDSEPEGATAEGSGGAGLIALSVMLALIALAWYLRRSNED